MSLRSGKACADAAERAGYRVTRIDVERDIAQVLAALLFFCPSPLPDKGINRPPNAAP